MVADVGNIFYAGDSSSQSRAPFRVPVFMDGHGLTGHKHLVDVPSYFIFSVVGGRVKDGQKMRIYTVVVTWFHDMQDTETQFGTN